MKGLDFELLERVRRGEDVWDAPTKEDSPEPTPAEDADDAFDELESSEVAAVDREKAAKKGQMATVRPGGKRTRDQLLAEMKAAREAKAKENALSTKFKKIGIKTPGSRIERDSQGQEVLIMVDEDGNEKRKVRKLQKPAEAADETASQRPKDMMAPDKDVKPLGMEVPEYYKQKLAEAEAKAKEEEEDDDDIFAGVGDDYDPLADLGSDSDDEEKEMSAGPAEKESAATSNAMPPPPRPAATARNYFKDSKTALVSEEKLKAPSMSDPSVQAALKKAAAMNPMRVAGDGDDDEEARAKAERHRKMLQNNDRDAEDMDMGFGTSRFEDEADADETTKIKLSNWTGGKADDGEDGHGGGGGGGPKRKRGAKKRKGDGNNAADVMRLVEQRRAEE